ncbi:MULTISPECIES: helix-turn-helix domain-containing protein [unclassified Streptomyces]|uniref:PucR family transcriptional regulator n=1 Tax=unclassified Streptomyces TaxID=2593676 RepID=UPI002E80D6F0|nr:helix-turn-helix domain-containing protein [Streptomyces sp. NBC_00589]WTI35682.1 helix-turn-helix domain-containing protein [Streptomyces sp. NBC_00775]WUB30644.1 helix-turn-helix domain-containing protein [Streptomyces sp. NBC_00589]
MPTTLRQLCDALGPSPLQLVTAPRGTQAPVTATVIYEPRVDLPNLDDVLLLAVGVTPSQAVRLVGPAAAAGLAGIVVKRYGEAIGELADAAQQAGVALLIADDDLAWQQLDALLGSALIATSPPDRGGGSIPGRSSVGADIGDLFALANAIAAAVGGATAIEDPHQRILAYSTLRGQEIDEERRQGILGLHVPYLADNVPQYRDLARTADVLRFPASPNGLPRIAVAVRAGSELLGTIWVVDAHDDLGEDATRALADAARIAALHLLRARTSHDLARRQRGDLLRRLFDDPASAPLIAPQLGLRLDAPAVVAAFHFTRADLTDPDTDPDDVANARAALQLTDLISLHCEAHYSHHGCALIDGTVYALLPAGAHRDFVADLAQRADRALRLPVRAALGPVVPTLRDAPSSRRDADTVLRTLAPTETAVAAFEDVRPTVTLADLAEHAPHIPRLAEGSGPAIHAHDLAHRTAYAETLLAYFTADSDVSAAARALSIHPNTCRYRLARAQELFHFTLADPDTRLVLWLQLRLK